MNKTIALLTILALFNFSCNDKYPINDLPEDTTAPSLTYPISSFSTVTRFIPFGGTLPSGGQCKGYDIFVSNANETITAACRGIVIAVNLDGAGNNDITVKYKSNSVYSFVYSGVKDVMVDVNDSIYAGTILGKVGSNLELSFTLIKSNEVLCPRTYGSAGFNDAIDLAIAKHNTANSTDSVFSACLAESLPK